MTSRAPILFTAALGLLAFLAACLAPFDWNASALCDFGQSNLVTDSAYRASAGKYFKNGFILHRDRTGYDGQFDFFIACDLLARHVDKGYRDAYRWQRILHPALASLLAGGDPAHIPSAMAAVTVLAVLGGTWALLSLTGTWWALAYAFAVGHLYGLQLSIGGPALSLALSVAGLLAWERKRMGPCWTALALSLLARESGILLIAPLCLWGLLNGRKRDAFLAGSAVLPFFAWELYLHQRFGVWGMGTSGQHVTLPFVGMAARAMTLEGSGVDFGHSLRGLANNAVLMAFLLYGALTAVDAVRTWLKEPRSLAAFLYATNAGFFCCLSRGQLVDLNGASRPFLTVLPFLVLCRARSKDPLRWPVLAGGLVFSLAVALKVLTAHPSFDLWQA